MLSLLELTLAAEAVVCCQATSLKIKGVRRHSLDTSAMVDQARHAAGSKALNPAVHFALCPV